MSAVEVIDWDQKQVSTWHQLLLMTIISTEGCTSSKKDGDPYQDTDSNTDMVLPPPLRCSDVLHDGIYLNITYITSE